MAQTMTKNARRSPSKVVRRRAASQKISDRRYYVQCAYRLAMAIITLIALLTVMGR